MRLLTVALAVCVSCASLSSAPNLPRTGQGHPSSYLEESADVFARAIQKLGGQVADPRAFPDTVDGFQDYLTVSGVHAVTAAEMTRPNHPVIAERLGFHVFLPAQTWWRRGAALALLIQHLRTVAGEGVYVRNWWRPPAYNAHPGVGGARKGDHPTANAVDLDYVSRAGRIRAERWLRALDRSARWLQLSLGLDDRTTHVGIGSPKGRREWHYAGWRPGTAA